MLDVLDDADNSGPFGGLGMIRSGEALTDGILAGPEMARQFVIDDDHTGRAGSVGWIEIAAAQKANAERLKIAGADLAEINRIGVPLGIGDAFRSQGGGRNQAAKGEDRGDRGAPDTRDGARLSDEASVVGGLSLV